MKNVAFVKKAIALALSFVLLFGIAGCGNKTTDIDKKEDAPSSTVDVTGEAGTAASDGTPVMEETTINIRVMNEFKNLDKVLAAYEEMTQEDPIMSNIKLNFSFVPGGEYKDKLNMALVAQEDYDLMFCGSWHGLDSFIQQGNFADVSPYFNNDNFPGLQRAFSEDFVDAMTSYLLQDDGSFQEGIYGINLATFYEDTRGFAYREDLRKKHDLPEITDEEALFHYVKTVSENEPELLGVSLWNFFRLDSPWYSAKHDNVYTQDNVNIFGDQTWVYVGLSEDHTTVQNVVVMGDSEEEFAKMPAGYQYDFISEYLLERTRWNPYLSPSRGSTETDAEKDAVITYTPLTGYESLVTDATEVNPDYEFGFYAIEDAQRNKESGAVICDMTTNNWLVVPEWSEKIDATMHFLDWMFGSQENNDLFTYGIIGEEWEPIGDDSYKLLDISEDAKYIMPSYSLTQNPNYIRFSEFVANDADIKSGYDYMYDAATYQLSPLAGFSFDSETIETQLANISALSNELQFIISLYDADEVPNKVSTWHEEAVKVGLEEIREELMVQLQTFLDAKNA